MKLTKKISILIVCSVFLMVTFYPIFAKAPPPRRITYYATDWDVTTGSHHSGNLYSAKYDDGDYFVAKASWYWFIFYYFDADIEFEFANVYADYVKVELKDNVIRNNMLVYVYYTSGNPDMFPEDAGDWDDGWLSDGTYSFSLDTSRIVDYVKISFFHAGGWGDKYLKVDYVNLVKYNII